MLSASAASTQLLAVLYLNGENRKESGSALCAEGEEGEGAEERALQYIREVPVKTFKIKPER